jgi:hypothetical protein
MRESRICAVCWAAPHLRSLLGRPAFAQSAGPSPWWRIASGARPRLPAYSSGWHRALLTSHWPWVVCRGSPRRAARASPLRFSGQWARLGSPDPSPRPPRRPTCARAGRAHCFVRRRSAVTTQGGTCFPPGHSPPHWGMGGGGGGAWFHSGICRVDPLLIGTEGGVVPYSRCPGCARGATPQSHSYQYIYFVLIISKNI